MKAPSITKGKLTVCIDPKWPFDINTLNADCEVVFSRRMPAHSTEDNTIADVLACASFDREQRAACSEANHKAVADEVVRAAAPMLAEALHAIVEDAKKGNAAIMNYKVEAAVAALKQAGYEE